MSVKNRPVTSPARSTSSRETDAASDRPPRLSDFDFDLPPELIAQAPARERSASRLLHVTGRGEPVDLTFTDLPGLVAPGDLLVFNDTRVIKARITGRKPTGGRFEALIERVVGPNEAWAQMKASHLPKPGASITLSDGTQATVLERSDRMFLLRFDIGESLFDWLEAHGDVPLPPYITRRPADEDASRYQTVYARQPGAVAAPTAGLHFDDAMLKSLARIGVESAFVTLHVGAGTFQPVTSEDLSQHRMHAEWFDVPAATAAAIEGARARGNRVLAVGTTTLRALESAAEPDGRVAQGARETRLFITPGYRFRVVERLVTNFHLPRSTLLMLVSAFAGRNAIRSAYAHAIDARYRFFSYGDAMLLERRDPAAV